MDTKRRPTSRRHPAEHRYDVTMAYILKKTAWMADTQVRVETIDMLNDWDTPRTTSIQQCDSTRTVSGKKWRCHPH